jgi:tetrahydromethanopterin S-methyltransferase subunit H
MLTEAEIFDRVQHSAIDLSAAADGVVVPALANTSIVVLGFYLVAGGGANNLRFKSSTGPTNLSGLLGLAANGGIVIPRSDIPLFKTPVGDGLLLNLSAATAVGGGVIWYRDRV